MKKLKGRIKYLNVRTKDYKSGVEAVSLIIKGHRFSGDFCLNGELDNGDLLEITYETIGFLNKLKAIEIIAKNSNENSIGAKLANILIIKFQFLIGIYIFWFDAKLYMQTTSEATSDKDIFLSMFVMVVLAITGIKIITQAIKKVNILYYFLRKL